MPTLIAAGGLVLAALCVQSPSAFTAGACVGPAPASQTRLAEPVLAPPSVPKRRHRWSWEGTAAGAAVGGIIGSPFAYAAGQTSDLKTTGFQMGAFASFVGVGTATGLVVDCVRFLKGSKRIGP